MTKLAALALAITSTALAQDKSLDGRPWNVSTGNLSVTFIQASPIGAHPRPEHFEPPPSLESQINWRKNGLVANEDYIAWGAVERTPGQWLWKQHDAVEQLLHSAGLKYVVYDWAHFPPVWLRDQRKSERTLMRCLEHDQETNYLSIFDPRTIAWYDHFYKNVHAHFGDRVDDIYACILGPYGEGNYPLNVPDWVNIGHCHEGYWAADEHATRSFQTAMRQKYATIGQLNTSWSTTFSSFDDVKPPKEVTGTDKYQITPALFPTPHDKRRWLDFITWYHQALIDFSQRSLESLLKYYPPGKVRLKPGGTHHGINPIAWGTYSPGYAKMVADLERSLSPNPQSEIRNPKSRTKIVLQPADCVGAPFGDKWLATAYHFYGVKLGTEPAGSLDKPTYVRRMFSDASCGASQHFTYEFDAHIPEIKKYIHLYTGQPGQTQIAVFCPTTFHRLGGDLRPTIEAAYPLRDLCDFDVLDELLIADGALTPDRYKALLIFQPEIIDQPILQKLDAFAAAGGRIVIIGPGNATNVEGADWPGNATAHRTAPLHTKGQWLRDITPILATLAGSDGQTDGLWTTRRGDQTLIFNSTPNPVTTKLDGQDVTISAHEIWTNR